MKAYALIGESGSGKSYNSITIAAKYKLDYIIDDGLLIYKNKVAAGKSAKKEGTYVAAVKRAVFIDDEQCQDVKDVLKNAEDPGILVLGTSEKMVEKIRGRLELPEYTQIIKIEDVSSKADIHKAKLTRQSQGKHVIPVPVMEIKKTFSGYFLDPLRAFRRNHPIKTEDKSIVRPTYSYMGEFSINDTVLCQLAAYEASKCEGVDKISRVTVDKINNDVVFNVDANVVYGINMSECSENIKKCVKDAIEKYASVYTDAVNVYIKSISFKK